MKVTQHAAYGLTELEADLIFLKQNGRCRICGKRFRPGRPPQVDHHHKTGAVRGLLCAYCNTTIGLLHEDVAWLRKAADHIKVGAFVVRGVVGRPVYTPDSPGAAGLLHKETS